MYIAIKTTYFLTMEVEISGGGVLIFSYLILIHQFDDLGGLCDNFGSDFIGCRFGSDFIGPPTACKRGLRVASWAEAAWYEHFHWFLFHIISIGCRFDGPPIAARLYLTNSAKRKRPKPPIGAQLMER